MGANSKDGAQLPGLLSRRRTANLLAEAAPNDAAPVVFGDWLFDAASVGADITGAGQIASAEAIGSPALAAAVVAAGVVSAEAFGADVVAATVALVGIPTAESLGKPSIGVVDETVPHAAQKKGTRRRLRWREFENLPRLDEPEQVAIENAGPNELANVAELQLQQESARLATLLAAAKIEQENARQRSVAAEIGQQIEAARQAANEAIAAAMLAERLAQEIEEIDVAYIVATLLND